jgi:hypothetical protein
MGASTADGEDFASRGTTRLFWASALARAALRYPQKGPLGLRLKVDGFTNLVRPRFRVLGAKPNAVVSRTLGAAASLELIVALE